MSNNIKKDIIIQFLKMLFVIFFFLLSFSFLTPKAHAAWYSANWGYRKQITIDHTKVNATQTNFPMLVKLASDANLSSHARSDGFDIVFTQSDGTTKLSHEREKYSSGTGELEAWVNIPSLSSTTDTIIYIYYGYSSSCDQTASACDSTFNATKVWDTNYDTVHHLGQTASCPTTINDSSTYATDGSCTGTPVSSTGQIAGDRTFTSASSQSINLSNPSALSISGAITEEAWVKATSFASSSFNDILSKASVTGITNYEFGVDTAEDGTAHFFYATSDNTGSNTFERLTTMVPTTGTWYHVVATQDGSGNVIIYVNGASVSINASSFSIAWPGTITTTGNAAIGKYGSNSARYFDGHIDEVRLSKIVRSASWVATEYNNQNSPSTFISLGVESTNASGITSTTYKISEYDFGSGGQLNNTSSTYSLYSNTGQLDGLSLSSTTYNALAGLTYQLTANVPSAPTVSNNGGAYYNKLSVTLNTSSNPTDTLYAIKVVSGGTQYVQANDTLGSTPVWQKNDVSGWGASGFTIIGLTQGTAYTISVSAKQGTYTQSQFGPSTTVSTGNTTFSLTLSSNAITFPQLDPGNVKSSTSTVTVTVTTNGPGGATVYALDTNSGLKSTNTNYTIAATSSDLSSASEGYGLRATAVGQGSGGPMEKVSPYNGVGNVVGLLDSTNKRSIFDSSGAAVSAGAGTFELQAKAGLTAKAATDYGDTITVIASGAF